MAVPPRLEELPKERTIRKQLGTLCTYGLQPFWVIDSCKILLGLDCVRDHHTDGELTEEGLAEALTAYLPQAVERVEKRQHRILLEIVLGLEPDMLGKTAKERRAEAGQRFRGPGSKAVTFGCIRQHHEPRALDALAAVVYADECAARN